MHRTQEPKRTSARLLVILAVCLVVSTAAALASTRTVDDSFEAAMDSTQPFLPLDSLSDVLPAPTAIDELPLLPFSAKKAGRVGAYRLGYWPAEKGSKLSAAYANPAGFIEVTPQNQDLPVSEHFELRQFLTHDQQSVWPKYLVLREPLIDKLELVIADLQSHGIPARNVQVMSGFRTPQYNQQGVGEGGRAANSRHQYGDAADIFVDDNGDGRMDDLNRDGRSTKDDARVILQAVNRVEHANPGLVGGAGLYSSTATHGPFIHIDARGQRARWGGA